MIPICQTIFPCEADQMRGNCFQACMASILELPLEDVPHAMMHSDWMERVNIWLASRGLGMVMVNLNTEESYIHPLPAGMIVMIGGRTMRHPSRLHSVVAKTKAGGIAWDYIHDPHPDKTFLTEATDITWIFPLDVVGQSLLQPIAK